jgi:enoyl-CoA hydratase
MIEVVMQGPGKNALGTGMIEFVRGKLREAAGAPVLITGTADAFSAGLDLKELQALDAAGMRAFLDRLEELYSALFTYPGPTAAAVNGHAIAGGCLVALACDVRVCAPEAWIRIGLNEVPLGLRFPPGILRLIRARLAPSALDEVVLGGGLHPPQEALRLGLVDEVREGVLDRARERLRLLAQSPAGAYAEAKRDLRGTSLRRPEDEEAFTQMLPRWTSPELKARIAAALEKRR